MLATDRELLELEPTTSNVDHHDKAADLRTHDRDPEVIRVGHEHRHGFVAHELMHNPPTRQNPRGQNRAAAFPLLSLSHIFVSRYEFTKEFNC